MPRIIAWAMMSGRSGLRSIGAPASLRSALT
jgi:hypothetical protein